MKKLNIGIFLSLLLMVGLCSCGEQKSNTKLVLNEVLIENESNFQDDYGVHSAWIEIFNRSFGSADLAGCLLKVSSQPGDTATYFIPKGDVLTLIKPRQHALFWADGEPNRGTFHTNFTLNAATNNWIGLYDSGKKLLDQIIVPAGTLQANQSYARVSDAANEWEVKGSSADKYVTPSTNNKTINSNAKMEKFEEHDSVGIGMSISAMSVVFVGLLLLFIAFKVIGRISVNLSKRNAMKVKGITDKQEAKEKKLGEAPGEVFAAIAMAMHEMQSDVHDVEETVLTITRVKRSYSPWSSKIYTLRETPHKSKSPIKDKTMKEYKYKINGNIYKVAIGDIEDNIAHVEVNGTPYKVEMEKAPKAVVKPVVRPASTSPAPAPTTVVKPAATSTGKSGVKSPLPGVILDIKVNVGDTVKRGKPSLSLKL